MENEPQRGPGRPRSVDGRKTSIYLRRRAEAAWDATAAATGQPKPDVLESALVDYARKHGVEVEGAQVLEEPDESRQ